MPNEVKKLLDEAIQRNADQMTNALEALVRAVDKAECREAGLSNVDDELAWWDAFIANQSQIRTLLVEAQGALMRQEAQDVRREAQEEALQQKNAGEVKFLKRLTEHGVTPSQFKPQTDETVAVIADLVMWKAKDWKYTKPQNPWLKVLNIYKDRVIPRPTEGRKGKPSKPGIPKRAGRHGGLNDYLFGDLIPAEWRQVEPAGGPVDKTDITKIENSFPRIGNAEFVRYANFVKGVGDGDV